MKDGQAAIRVFVDPDARLDVVMAVAILWNLQLSLPFIPSCLPTTARLSGTDIILSQWIL